jgi:hypothetical protein
MMGKTDREQHVTSTDLADRFHSEDRLDQLTAAAGPPSAAADSLQSRPAPARHAAHPGACGPPAADVGMLARVRAALLQM